MTLDNAAIYVARVLGGASNTQKIVLAKESIAATAESWSLANDWHFLLNRESIAVLAGTSRYALTAAGSFSKPFSARFTQTLLRPVFYRTQQYIDSVTGDQTIQGDPEVYTIIDDDADFSAGTEVQKLQLYPTPRANDTLLIRYYRIFNGAADPVDVPKRFIYTFLDCARIHLLMTHDSSNPRLPLLIRQVYGTPDGRSAGTLQLAIAADRNEGGDDQYEGFMTITDLDTGFVPRGPTDFWPRGDR